MPPLAAYPFSAVWTSLWGWSSQERENGVTYGGQSWLGRWAVDSFFPPCGCEAAILEEGVGDHRHERVTMKALPGPALEVIKAEFFFQLLMRLLADPSRLDRGCQSSKVGVRG